LMYKW